MTRNFSVLCGSSLQICQGVPLSSPSTPRTQAWVLKASPSPPPAQVQDLHPKHCGELGGRGWPARNTPASCPRLPSAIRDQPQGRQQEGTTLGSLWSGERLPRGAGHPPTSFVKHQYTWYLGWVHQTLGFVCDEKNPVPHALKPAPSEGSLWPQELKGSVAPRVVQAAASGLGPAPLPSSSPSPSSPTGLGALGPWVSCPWDTVCCLLGRRRAQVLGSEATEMIGWGWTCPR